jgi:hypothetical protein
MLNALRVMGLIVCAAVAAPAYGGYQFQKITGEWVEMWSSSTPVLNNQGQVLFRGEDWARLSLYNGTGLTQIGGGPFSEMSGFDMNDAGEVVFTSYNWNWSSFLTRYSGGLYQVLASSQSPYISEIGRVAINNQGEIAVSITTEDPYYASWQTGLYKVDTNNEFTPWIHPELNPFDGFYQMSLADTGAVAFDTDFSGSYLSPAPNSYIPIAQSDPHGYFWPVASPINAGGQVAYLDWTDWQPPALMVKITDGLTTHTQNLFAFSNIETLALNDAGDIAYFGMRAGPEITGIFVNDETLPVIAVGQQLEGSTVDWLELSSRGFNDAGQIVFWAGLSNGSQGLYLATPVGEGVPGDFNGDGVVNTADINPFILALTGASGQSLGETDPLLLAADTNGDGVIDTADIVPFIALLTGGGESLSHLYTGDINSSISWLYDWDGSWGGPALPEPGGAAVLLLAAGVGLMARRRG